MRVANHDATKRFFAEFTTQFVMHIGGNGAPEDAELGGVGRDDVRIVSGTPPVRPTERL
jgi:glycerol uptake facilitator-like aquaporin